MKFHLLTLVLCLGAVWGQYGDNVPAETQVAANPATPVEQASEPIPAAPSTDSKVHTVGSSVDAPPAGCPVIEPPPAPLHCTYESVEQGGCPKPTLKCNCPANEAFLECATCEPTCDNPTPICTEECKPAQCQCVTGHARRPSGECVPVAECQQKATQGAEIPTQPSATAPETANAPQAGQPSTGSCATMTCESDYDCVEQVGGCVKKNTGNCAVSPCMPNHKCIENVGCRMEDSSTTHEASVPLAMANADMKPSVSHSTDFAHEETIPIPHNQPSARVICADTKCSPGSVCIEEYGCFKPHDRFIESKNGGMVESSCERVVCNKQHSRCVHGSCVPVKMPWKLGHVCSQNPCPSPSMLCVDDIGCFDASPVISAQQEEVPETVAKTDSAPSPVAPSVDETKTAGQAFMGMCATMKCEDDYECMEQVGGCVKKNTGNCAVSPCMANHKCIENVGCQMETANAPHSSQAFMGMCATMKCEGDYDCMEHVGGCVKKNTKNCAVSPCMANHKCVENVGCQMEVANAPHAGQASMGMCATMKCESDYECMEQVGGCVKKNTGNCAVSPCMPNHKCIENVGCHMEAANEPQMESSCERVFCDKQRSRCVHGSCVPLEMPWRHGYVCNQNPCSSSSMLCVDDIGCFDASPFVSAQQEQVPDSVAKTESAPSPVAAPADETKTAEVKTSASSKSTETSASKETESTPTEHVGTNTEAEKSKSKETSETAGTTNTETVASSQLDSQLPKETGALAGETAQATSETQPEATKETAESKEAAEPTTEEQTPAEPAAPAATADSAAPAEPTKTETPSETPAAHSESSEAASSSTSNEKVSETAAAAPANEDDTAATETKTEPEVAPSGYGDAAAATGTETKSEATGTAEVKVGEPMMDSHPETLPSMDDSKMHHGSGMPTCMECEEMRKGMNGRMVCVRKHSCCPGGAAPTMCAFDPCKGFEQTCSKAKMCVAMMCGHCSAMIYDHNMMPVKVGVDNCFMPFSITNDGDMPRNLPDHLIHG